MPQITLTSSPPSRLPAVGSDASAPVSQPGDGFEALLAGLMGIAVQPPQPIEPLRPLGADAVALNEAPTEDGHRGDAPEAPLDKLAGERRPAQPGTTADAGAALASSPQTQPTTPHSATGTAESVSGARAPTEPAAGEGSPVDRPGGDARAERQPAGHAAADEPAQDGRRGRTSGRQARSAEAATARAGVTAAAHAPRLEERAPAVTARGMSDAVAVERPLRVGPALLGGRGGFAQLTIQTASHDPAEAIGLRGLGPLPAGPLAAAEAGPIEASSRSHAAPPVRQLASAIERAVGGDVRRLTVHLYPQALGSIEIALEVDAERRLAVSILVERPETLELLRGEARELQRMLAERGLDFADAGIEFGLMGGERRERGAAGRDGAREAPEAEAAVEALGGEPPGPTSEPRPAGIAGRLNLSI